ncbi:YheC/YheD family protein [Paenibacillus sp. NPDC056579]|uniref:YheC/YheD family protein n=1 Tax=Paenibacillus sp. NPDC056579 TaxID=3345871 RepID=UPI0036C1D2E8
MKQNARQGNQNIERMKKKNPRVKPSAAQNTKPYKTRRQAHQLSLSNLDDIQPYAIGNEAVLNPGQAKIRARRRRLKYGKLRKHFYMTRFKVVRRHLPDTRKATRDNLRAMLRAYPSLFLKPDLGSGGHGILKIMKTPSSYTVKYGTETKHYTSFRSLYTMIRPLLLKRRYVLQKGIRLLRIKQRPFDIRVMVQKNRNRKFVVTGIIGRLAKEGKIVTNYHSGGTPLPVEVLLRNHIGIKRRGRYVKKIALVGKRASIAMSKRFRDLKAFGVDIAIDPAKKLWILEVNTKPDKQIFNTLNDKTMYRRVLRFAKY